MLQKRSAVVVAGVLALAGCATDVRDVTESPLVHQSPVNEQEFTVELETNENIDSVEMVIDGVGTAPMFEIDDGLYQATMAIPNCAGAVGFTVRVAATNERIFPKVGTFSHSVTGLPEECAGDVELAQTFTVDTGDDLVDPTPGDGVCGNGEPGTCSLRAAVMESNAHPGSDVIRVGPRRHVLTREGSESDEGLVDAVGDLDITDDVTIEGITGSDGSVLDFLNDDLGDTAVGLTDDPDKDAAFAKVDGNQIDRVFQVADGATLQLLRLAVLNGQTEGQGGGIRNDGSLRLERVAIVENESLGQTSGAGGAGVYNAGDMSASEFVIAHNFGGAANPTGGGIRNFGTADLTRGLLAYNYARFGSEISNSEGAVLSASDITVLGDPFASNEPIILAVRNFGEMRLSHMTFDGHDLASIVLFNQNDATMTLGNSLLFDRFGSCEGPIESFGGNVTDGECDLMSVLEPSFDHIDVSVSAEGLLRDDGGFSPVYPFVVPFPGSTFVDPSDAGSPVVRQSFTDQRGSGFPRSIDRDGDGENIADAGAWEHPAQPDT